jgi:hypothetical protein
MHGVLFQKEKVVFVNVVQVMRQILLVNVKHNVLTMMLIHIELVVFVYVSQVLRKILLVYVKQLVH